MVQLRQHNTAAAVADITCAAFPAFLLILPQNIRPEARTYNAIISTCNGAGRFAEVRVEAHDRSTTGLVSWQPAAAAADEEQVV